MATPSSNLTLQNFYESTLSSSINATDTTIPLNSVPTGTEGYLVIEPDNATSREIIFFNSKTVSSVVCPSAAEGRGQDGTSATSHASGATVRMTVTAGYFTALQTGDGLNIDAVAGQPFGTGWVSSALPAVSSVTNNGNRSYDITFASTVASLLSPGMRIRTTRTVTAPTQCTDLESGSSQYYSKTSPAGMTFTDDFVVSAWVKQESYGTTMVASRYNGTSGWYMYISSAGQVFLTAHNGGVGNYVEVKSYQSIPLGRWVHVTAQLDMSAFTASSTTCYVMIDGVDVPVSLTRAGTNPTALVQAGNLEIGAYNGGTSPYDGKLAQVAIYSAKVTQANIRATISQGLSGSESSLISAYSFNNSINDLNTTNANNLTANGGALATNADSPFSQDGSGVPSGTTDYALVMKVSTTTATVQLPEGCTIPTSGGVSAVAYSTTANPYGWVADKGRWRVSTLILSHTSALGTTVTTTYAFGASGQEIRFTCPIGMWSVVQDCIYQVTPTAALADIFTGLSTSASAFVVDGTSFGQRFLIGTANHSVATIVPMYRADNVILSAATTYYPLIRSAYATSSMQLRGIASTTVPERSEIYAIPAGI